nr:hypothetical protein [Tanacetum cinerariifolium]
KLPICYNDDDDEESSNPLEDNIISELPPYSALTPSEPIDSLSVGDEHLNTILATKSDKFIKSCVENLVPNPRMFIEKLLDNYSPSLPANESYHFDIPSPYRPPAKPPDGNTRTLNIKMMGDASDQKRSAECPMIINGKNTPVLDVPLFHFYPLDQFKYGGN